MATQISSVKFGTTDITKVNINNTWYFWLNHTTDITHSGGFDVHGSKTGLYTLNCWIDSHWGEQSDVNLTWHGHNEGHTQIIPPGTNTVYNWITWRVYYKIAGKDFEDGATWRVRIHHKMQALVQVGLRQYPLQSKIYIWIKTKKLFK